MLYEVITLYLRLRKKHPGIGYATVHRTLKLFAESGIASVLNFGDGAQRFEACGGEHHDHLVCTACGLIIEFENPQIVITSYSIHYTKLYDYFNRSKEDG